MCAPTEEYQASIHCLAGSTHALVTVGTAGVTPHIVMISSKWVMMVSRSHRIEGWKLVGACGWEYHCMPFEDLKELVVGGLAEWALWRSLRHDHPMATEVRAAERRGKPDTLTPGV